MTVRYTYEVSNSILISILLKEVTSSILKIFLKKILERDVKIETEYYEDIGVLLYDVIVSDLDFDRISELSKDLKQLILDFMLNNVPGFPVADLDHAMLESREVILTAGTGSTLHQVARPMQVATNAVKDWNPHWGHDFIDSKVLRAGSKGQPQVKVAVVGTGVDFSHPDLIHSLENMQDAFLQGNVFNRHVPESAWDPPQDFNGHGTAVVSLICGESASRVGWDVGVAANASISTYKFAEGCVSTTHRYLQAICLAIGEYPEINGKSMKQEYASAIGSHKPQILVITGTFDSGETPLEDTAIGKVLQYAIEKLNIIVIAAAGNCGMNKPVNSSKPVGIPGLISVGAYATTYNAATKQFEALTAFFSNNSSDVSIYAPGYALAGSTPQNLSVEPCQMRMLSGTSYATGLVGGAVAAVFHKIPPGARHIPAVTAKILDLLTIRRSRDEVEDNPATKDIVNLLHSRP